AVVEPEVDPALALVGQRIEAALLPDVGEVLDLALLLLLDLRLAAAPGVEEQEPALRDVRPRVLEVLAELGPRREERVAEVQRDEHVGGRRADGADVAEEQLDPRALVVG